MAQAKRPGDDVAVSPNDDLTVINALREYKREAEDAKKDRDLKNEQNNDAFLGRQDFSHKQAGQSKEFLPLTGVAVEQFSAFVKRALVQFGDWFSVELGGNSPIEPEKARELLKCYLDRIPDGAHKTTTFPLVLSDAVKSGLLESLIILKVHGRHVERDSFFVESRTELVPPAEGQEGPIGVRVNEDLKRQKSKTWRLMIEVVRAADYFPDPTGRNLYEIHRVERDLSDVISLAEGTTPIYDPRAVAEIKEDFAAQDAEMEKSRRQNQGQAAAPSFRKRVVIDEFWGTILNTDGKVVHSNVVAAIANDKYLIRKPEKNPNWHGESPFVTAPIIRVPGSVWHKALYDDAVPLNFAANEVFNLMVDGGLASVWGINQLREGHLVDPDQVSGGVAQGTTLIVDDSLPIGGKVYENVSTGDVPADAFNMLTLLMREFQGSALTNDTKLGQESPKQVTATEVVEASQSSGVTLDSIAGDIELGLIAGVLRKSWMNILQNADDLGSGDVINAIGEQGAMAIAQMSPARRFASMAQGCAFKVKGLSQTVAKTRDFQKLMAMLQAVGANPLLLQAFFQEFSPGAVLKHMMRTLNINPDDLKLTPEEAQQGGDRFKQLQQFSQLTGGGGKGGSIQSAGDSDTDIPAEVNQQINPLTGAV